MEEQFKAPEKIQLSDEEIANLSDTRFKELVIRMLQELTGYSNSIKKDPGSNEGRIMWNKEKTTGNQQWQAGNQDLNQQFGAEGRKKHSTRTKWRSKN